MNTSTRTLKALAGALLIVTSTAALGAAYASVGTDPAPAPPAENKYIGAEKCKSCHSAAESGDQYGKWKAMKHAHAFESLASEEAKKIATEKGIADPQKADECLQCHVTAFKVPDTEIKKGFDDLLRALEAYVAALESQHLPVPPRMRTELQIVRNLFGR